MNTQVMFSSEDRELCTPDDLFRQLDREFAFEIDVAANEANALCAHFFTDCLTRDWGQSVCWMNPPYGDPEEPCKKNCKKKRCPKRGYCITEYAPGIIDFVRKADAESRKGCTVVCLLPHRTDTEWWKKYCSHHERREIEGRLRFLRDGKPIGTAPFPSVIVVMRPLAAEGPYRWTRVMPVC